MNNSLGWLGAAVILGLAVVEPELTSGLGLALVAPAWAEQPLAVVYPPAEHETTASQIFLIGTAPASGEVTVNGRPIPRSTAGHFAPSFPLELGENLFTLRYGEQELLIRVNRTAAGPVAPVGVAFGEGSLTPAVDLARLPNEPICFSAVAPAQATVSVTLNQQTIPLLPQPSPTDLPPNSAVLTLSNQPVAHQAAGVTYQGCQLAGAPADLGLPEFQLSLDGTKVEQAGAGRVRVLNPAQLEVVEVTGGTARSGPSTDYSRLTPLPKGTRASVTGREGDWLRLDYGGWIRTSETQVIPNAAPPHSLIRSVRAETTPDWTEIAFPLQVAVPVSVQQSDRSFTLTLYNTTAQTDTILLNQDAVIQRLDWQQTAPGQVQYRFTLQSAQQWGYKLRYEGTTLVLSLRHPPQLTSANRRSLAGVRILLDPGHGGPEDLGARGPTGYPEKDVALKISQLLQQRLEAQGATVIMTREADIDLLPQDRAAMIEQSQPTLAISLHYNALPDDGDAINTAGIGTFWYNSQSHSLAAFLQRYLVETLDRPDYGLFWNNLALTRPTTAPAVLLELGFMINPEEFEWIIDPAAQTQLADALAAGITDWLYQATAE
ncbi:MAG: N-acetylmuramoyl-L-alanine amidase [Elainella sp.]